MTKPQANLAPRPHAETPVWDISDLYASPDDPAFAADCASVMTEAKAFRARYYGKTASLGGEALAEAVAALERLEETEMKLGAYAFLYFSERMTDAKRGAFSQSTRERLSEAESELVFFSLELCAIDDAALEEAYRQSSALARYRPWLDHVRAMRPYRLKEEEERIILEKDVTGGQSWVRLFDETLAHLEFTVGGETLSLDGALHLLQSPDPAKRKAAAEALSGVLAENGRLFTFVTNTLAKDKALEDARRGFPSPMASRHLANDVEPEVVEALLGAVESRYEDISHRYYRMKAGWLGGETMPYWDRNAPVSPKEEAHISWDEAKDIVLSAYREFSPEMAAIGETFFDRNWIHAKPVKGKDSGAYSHSTVPSVHPYILMNFQGTARDVMTLAHELGHGVHQYLARPQGAFLSDTPLTVAETASVFGEQLTFRSLLKRAKTAEERKTLLAGKAEDMINTVVRQTAFCRFEQKVHEGRRKGELSSEEIGKFWLEIQAAALGQAVRLEEAYAAFWMYIPHFVHTPFYVYAYAFGDCLVNSLYRVYQERPEGFVEKYLDLLKAGGSKRYDTLLAPFGLDPKDPSFWHKGLDMIAGIVGELEGM
jgi:oligoendopeptidase F